jgi:hypothetical protein
VILAGSGVRAARATAEFDAVIQRLGIPVTTAWTHDLIAFDDPLFCGRPGTIGTRAGNFTVQNADLLADSRQPPQRPAGQLQLAGLRAAAHSRFRSISTRPS